MLTGDRFQSLCSGLQTLSDLRYEKVLGKALGLRQECPPRSVGQRDCATAKVVRGQSRRKSDWGVARGGVCVCGSRLWQSSRLQHWGPGRVEDIDSWADLFRIALSQLGKWVDWQWVYYTKSCTDEDLASINWARFFALYMDILCYRMAAARRFSFSTPRRKKSRTHFWKVNWWTTF